MWEEQPPVIRITTFGPFLIECLEDQRYTPISADKIDAKGVLAARSLLKLLLCQPHRYAPRDWVLEQFWPDMEHKAALHRVGNAVWILRRLLCPPDAQDSLRSLLLTSTASEKGTGLGYQLAAYPLIWVDADAFEWYVEQAARAARFGDDPLPLWQRAYELGERGTFLSDEIYSEWTTQRRSRLDGHFRQCVFEVSRLLIAQGQRSEAEVYLRNYVVAHPTDEDVLRPLMELLGQQERYQELLSLYQTCATELAHEDRQPDSRTQDIAEYFKSKQIRRVRPAHLPAQALLSAKPYTRHLLPSEHTLAGERQDERKLSHINSYQNISLEGNVGQERRDVLPGSRVQMSSTEQQLDTDTSSSLKRKDDQYSLISDIEMMKKSHRNLFQDMLHLMSGVMTGPPTFSQSISSGQFPEAFSKPFKIDDFTLSYLQATIRSYYQLFVSVPSKSDLLSGLWGHLQTVLHYLKYARLGITQNQLYSLASECAQLIGEVLFDMEDYQSAQSYYLFSIDAAKEAGNSALRAIGLGRLSFLPLYKNEPSQACSLLQEAKQLLTHSPRSGIHTWLALVEAETLAHLQEEIACEEALERATMSYHQEMTAEDKLWTRLNDATIPGYKGACYLQLRQPRKALDALSETLAILPQCSSRHQSILLTDRAAATLQMNEIDETCKLLMLVLETITRTKSLLAFTRVKNVCQDLEPFQDTPSVQGLAKVIHDMLPSMITSRE